MLALPGYWEDQVEALRDFDGVVWLRKEFELMAAEASQPAQLALARIDDHDSTWMNGVPVGSIREYLTVRRYAVPGPLLRAGRNVVAVRVVDTGGGIWGAAADMRLATATRTLSLAGPWQYQVPYDPATPPVPSPSGPRCCRGCSSMA